MKPLLLTLLLLISTSLTAQTHSDTLDVIGKAVIKGLGYKELYYQDERKIEILNESLQIADSVIQAQSKTIDNINFQLIESLKDRGVSPFMTYLMTALGTAVGVLTTILILR